MDVRRAEAYLCLSDFEEAKRYGELSVSHPINNWPSFTVLISTLGHLGQLSEAEVAMAKMKNQIITEPEIISAPEDIMRLEFVKNTLPFIDSEFARVYLTGLQKASFPD